MTDSDRGITRPGGGTIAALFAPVPSHPLDRGGGLAEGGTDNILQLDSSDMDAEAYHRDSTTNFGSIDRFRVGNDGSAQNWEYRGFVRFDLSSIPLGSTVNACTLGLFCYWRAGADTYYVRQVTQNWAQNTLNWVNQPAVTSTGQSWVYVDNYQFYNWDVTSIAQQWVSGSSPNYGLRVSKDASTSVFRAYFRTKEDTSYSKSRRPKMTVVYTPPGGISITNISRSPQYPISSETVLVSARIFKAGGAIDSTRLRHSNDRVNWSSLPEDSIRTSDSTHFFHVPPQGSGESVHVRIAAFSGTDSATVALPSFVIPIDVSIYDIQFCDTTVTDTSPYFGKYVHTAGLMTGMATTQKFYVGDAGGGPWHGLFVYRWSGGPTYDVGDSLDVVGVMSEFRGLTEILPNRVEDRGPGQGFDTTKISLGESRLEAYEGVAVRFDTVKVLDSTGMFNADRSYRVTNLPGSDTAKLYVIANSAFAGGQIPQDYFNLVANMGDYDGAEITPRYREDVIPIVDIAAVEILAPPASLVAGDTVSPVAVVKNMSSGTIAKNVPVTFRIGTVYNVMQSIPELLAGETDTLVFNTWTAAAGTYPLRAFVSYAGDPDRSNDTVYGSCTVTGGGGPTGAWTEVRSVPGAVGVKDGGWLAYNEGNGLIYLAKGYKTSEFYSYDPDGDSFSTLAVIPAGAKPPKKGCDGIADGSNYVYMTKGNNTLEFWRYDIEANVWESLPGVPPGARRKGCKKGTDLSHVTGLDADYVYLLKGYGTEFYRFNVSTNAWDPALTDVPAGAKPKVDEGSWLCWDQNLTLCFFKAKYGELWPYNLGTGTWGFQLAPMPQVHPMVGKNKKPKDGSAGAWYDGSIYALKGGNTCEFWKYVPGDSWFGIDTIPQVGSTGKKKRVKTGGDIVSRGDGSFFALKGNKTRELWRYAIEPTACGLRPLAGRSGVAAGASEIRPASLGVVPSVVFAGIGRLRYALPSAGQAVLSVYDAAGRRAMRRVLALDRRGLIPLDLRGLSPGTYFARLETQGPALSCRFCVTTAASPAPR